MVECLTWEVAAFSASSAWLAHITVAAQKWRIKLFMTNRGRLREKQGAAFYGELTKTLRS